MLQSELDAGITPRSFTLVLPTRVKISNKTTKSLNLNIYRNLHYQSLAKQKKKFDNQVKHLLRRLPELGTITLDYVIFKNTNHKLDTMNVGTVVDKYFSDSLVNAKIITDDNSDIIVGHTFSCGGKADVPHAVVTITEVQTRKELADMKAKKDMRIFLDKSEITDALIDYVLNKANIDSTASTVQVSIEKGEIVAEIVTKASGATQSSSDDVKTMKSSIKEATDTNRASKTAPVPGALAPKKRGRGRPPGSKNKSKTPVPSKPDPEEKAEADDLQIPENSGDSDTSGSADTAKSETSLPFAGDATEEEKEPKQKQLAFDDDTDEEEEEKTDDNTDTKPSKSDKSKSKSKGTGKKSRNPFAASPEPSSKTEIPAKRDDTGKEEEQPKSEESDDKNATENEDEIPTKPKGKISTKKKPKPASIFDED